MLSVDWGVVVIALVIALGSWVIHSGETTGGVLVILIGCGFFVPLYLNAKLMLSTLHLDDNGITAIAFGRSWKYIMWNDVKVIRWGQWRNPGYRRPTKTFLVCMSERNRSPLRRDGPIVFDDTIVGFQFLLDILHEKSRLHGFALTPLNG